MIPRLPGCLFKFIQKQPPEVTNVRKKTEKLFLEISPKIHKENTCVLKKDFGAAVFL